MSSDPARRLLRPEHPTGTGVLVLAGSSGRVDLGRARVLSGHGAVALAIRWFGGPGQQPGPFAVPLEMFSEAIDVLAAECDHLAIIGTSFGTEAALLSAARDGRIAATVALAPSSVSWGGWDGSRWRSHWTAGGVPVPYVPFLADWEAVEDPPAYRSLYELSFDADSQATQLATIPVERIAGDVVLVAGADDQVWPSVKFANRIATRRREHDLATVVVTHEHAGHRTILPGEPRPEGGAMMRRGGTLGADSELGIRAWPHIASALRLRQEHR